MSEKNLLSMTAPLRENFDIPYHDIGDHNVAPKAAFVAGLHGNEINGVFVLSRLADFLRGVEAGERPGQRLAGRVIIIPAVNVLGINIRLRNWPFDKTDLNRMFPGYNLGETTQRIASATLTATRDAFYKIDIHSSNLDIEMLPQVRLYDPSDAEKKTAMMFGLPAVVERPVNPVFTSTLNYAWKYWGGENFVIQMGYAGNLQLNHCERVFRSIVKFLEKIGVIAGVDLAEEEDEDSHYFGINNYLPMHSDSAGMFVSNMTVGRWLQASEVIGYVYDSFNGVVKAEIKSPVAGLLTGIRRQPMLFEGDMLARIHTIR